MENLKVKIVTGFRKDQYHTISAEEAHKAYYLFLHPEQRGIFKNGLAIIGNDIRGIEPDYNATMGWNPGHQLDGDDWNEIKRSGIDREFRQVFITAQQIANIGDPRSMSLSLSEASKNLKLNNGHD